EPDGPLPRPRHPSPRRSRLRHSPRQQSPPRHPCRNPLLRLPPRLRKRNPDIPVGLFSRCPIPHPKIPQQLSLPRPPIAIRHLQFRPHRRSGRCAMKTAPKTHVVIPCGARNLLFSVIPSPSSRTTCSSFRNHNVFLRVRNLLFLLLSL